MNKINMQLVQLISDMAVINAGLDRKIARIKKLEGMLADALSEYARKNDLSEAPEDHWTRRIL